MPAISPQCHRIVVKSTGFFLSLPRTVSFNDFQPLKRENPASPAGRAGQPRVRLRLPSPLTPSPGTRADRADRRGLSMPFPGPPAPAWGRRLVVATATVSLWEPRPVFPSAVTYPYGTVKIFQGPVRITYLCFPSA